MHGAMFGIKTASLMMIELLLIISAIGMTPELNGNSLYMKLFVIQTSIVRSLSMVHRG